MGDVEALWLACGVLPGFRPGERRVVIRTVGREEPLRLEVDARLVRTEEPLRNGTPVAGKLRVLLFAWDVHTVTVLLPAPGHTAAGLVEVSRSLVAQPDEHAR